MVILAYLIQSVWALVIGGLVGSIIRMMLYHLVLPGIRNRLHWNRSAVRDLIGFGKYIFFSTIAGFLISQGDRAILGTYLTLAELGVYSVGFIPGMVPFVLCKVASNRVIFPLYRIRPPAESSKNTAHINRARRLTVSAALAFSMLLAFSGIALIEFLYDPRYAVAGPIVVLLSFSLVPQIVFVPYTGVMTANGDSRRFFILQASTATVQIIYLFVGISWLGIFGAIIAPGLATLTTYPLRIAFVSRYKAWDPRADCGFMVLGFSVNGVALWLNWEAVTALIG